MRKLIMAAAVAAIATVTLVGRADAQAPSRVRGAYGSASQYPTYPPQYPTTSQRQHDRRYDARNDHDEDDDDNGNWGDNSARHDRGRHKGFDHSRHNGYGKGAKATPSRANGRDWTGRSARSRRGDDRDERSNRNGRDRG